jgi:hypothetical protein
MTDTKAPIPDEHAAVRIIGTPTDAADHPALRKIARAVLSIAARQFDDAAEQSSDGDDDA